ncbi:hypothetical protein ABB27_01800 [Stenotrophomonas terrae]|uniref:Uncharacterized protein n=1 Tax=Stenotrophomonas terrae TaxID=405446 RepID=A0A0R0CR94_9GAMM|nr:hypothetical protein ABB27_01800 [Stenotrophomonas terrae]
MERKMKKCSVFLTVINGLLVQPTSIVFWVWFLRRGRKMRSVGSKRGLSFCLLICRQNDMYSREYERATSMLSRMFVK